MASRRQLPTEFDSGTLDDEVDAYFRDRPLKIDVMMWLRRTDLFAQSRSADALKAVLLHPWCAERILQPARPDPRIWEHIFETPECVDIILKMFELKGGDAREILYFQWGAMIQVAKSVANPRDYIRICDATQSSRKIVEDDVWIVGDRDTCAALAREIGEPIIPPWGRAVDGRYAHYRSTCITVSDLLWKSMLLRDMDLLDAQGSIIELVNSGHSSNIWDALNHTIELIEWAGIMAIDAAVLSVVAAQLAVNIPEKAESTLMHIANTRPDTIPDDIIRDARPTGNFIMSELDAMVRLSKCIPAMCRYALQAMLVISAPRKYDRFKEFHAWFGAAIMRLVSMHGIAAVRTQATDISDDADYYSVPRYNNRRIREITGVELMPVIYERVSDASLLYERLVQEHADRARQDFDMVMTDLSMLPPDTRSHPPCFDFAAGGQQFRVDMFEAYGGAMSMEDIDRAVQQARFTTRLNRIATRLVACSIDGAVGEMT